MDCQWVWSHQSVDTKLRTIISSEGLGGNSAKFCTSENFCSTVASVIDHVIEPYIPNTLRHPQIGATPPQIWAKSA